MPDVFVLEAHRVGESITFTLAPDQARLLEEALFLGQEQLQIQWERSLSSGTPQEVSAALWKKWSDARYMLFKLSIAGTSLMESFAVVEKEIDDHLSGAKTLTRS